MSMRNIKLVISYDGSDFHGWQTQPGLRTVQHTLEQAILETTGERPVVNASGRTDTGVHAVGQVVNFRTETGYSAEVWLRAINARLPADVVVREAAEASLSFDANRNALRKLYRYFLHLGRTNEVFLRRYVWHVPHELNVEAMRSSAQVLLGQHDFHSFETEWPNRASSVRTITQLSIGWKEHCFSMRDPASAMIAIDVEADGFLYNMVRSIVGTLVNVGRGYWPAAKVAEILEAKDRRQAGPTAPAQGLFLMRVDYEDDASGSQGRNVTGYDRER